MGEKVVIEIDFLDKLGETFDSEQRQRLKLDKNIKLGSDAVQGVVNVLGGMLTNEQEHNIITDLRFRLAKLLIKPEEVQLRDGRFLGDVLDQWFLGEELTS